MIVFLVILLGMACILTPLATVNTLDFLYEPVQDVDELRHKFIEAAMSGICLLIVLTVLFHFTKP